MKEIELLDDTSSMKRLKYKAKLIVDASKLYLYLSEKEKALSHSFLRKSRKTILKDFNKGIRMINRKVPVFVELPKYEQKTDGVYQKVVDNKPEMTEKGDMIFEISDLEKLPDKEDL